MDRAANKAEILENLRRTISLGPDSQGHVAAGNVEMPLGIEGPDRALQGGFARGALHEIAPVSIAHMGAASGFALALASLAQAAGRETLWIQQDFAALEGGGLYAPGLAMCGVAIERLLLLRVAKPVDALWAMEEALTCKALASIVMELAQDNEADLTATRRLHLAAREGDTLALLLRQRPGAQASAAITRWEVSALPGMEDEWGGMGKPRLGLNLTRNRRGPCGRWSVAWDRYENRFDADTLPLALASASRDGSDHAPARRAI